jgi:hypothetical protein
MGIFKKHKSAASLPDIREGRRLLKLIESDSKKRRKDPVATVVEAAHLLWRDMSYDEAAELFAHMHSTTPWWTTDVLWSLHQVIDNPPEDIGRELEKVIHVGIEDDPQANPPKYREWLVERTEELEAAIKPAK